MSGPAEESPREDVNDPGSVDEEMPGGEMATAISSLVGAVMRDFNSSAEATMRSQNQLSSSLDRLTRELDKLLEDAPVTFITQQATKISGVRKRVSSLNLVFKSMQRRLDNIDRMISLGSSHSHEKPKDETPG